MPRIILSGYSSGQETPVVREGGKIDNPKPRPKAYRVTVAALSVLDAVRAAGNLNETGAKNL